METQKNEIVKEVEGVRLSNNALRKIFYFQHDMKPEFAAESSEKLRFNNEGINREVESVNEDIHRLIEIVNLDESYSESVLEVMKRLNKYKNLLEALSSPE